MKVILIAVMVALATPSALAQAVNRQPENQPGQQITGKRQRDAGRALSAQAKIKKAREEERAANSALQRLPDKPYDPWRNAR